MKKSHRALSGVLVAASAALLVGGTAALAATQAGSSADPLVTRSYAEGTYKNAVIDKAAVAAKTQLSAAQTAADNALSSVQAAYSDSAAEDALAKQVAAAMGAAVQKESAALTAGTTVTTPMGTELCLASGAVNLTSGTLINLTTGKTVAAGGALTRNQLYLAAEGGAVLRVTAATKLDVRGSYTATASGTNGYIANYTAYADALHELGLFAGSDLGYELERVPSRTEGLVMLLRLLGKEQAAQAYSGSHPFRDVPDWASKYVAYAYQAGYTSGISATQFGAQQDLGLNDYMTFLLRALGYNDLNGDFSWSTAADTAVGKGILTTAHRQQITAHGKFYRDDIVYTSYQTLFLPMKGSTERLCDRLIAQGVFAQVDLDNAAEMID